MDNFLFLGEHSVTDFINTELKPSGKLIDLLQTHTDVKGWFKEAGLISNVDKIHLDDSFFNELIEYRNLIKKSFFEYLDDKKNLDTLIKKTNEILKQNEVFLQISSIDTEYVQTFKPNKKNANIFLTTIAIELTKLLSSKEFKYLKRCNNHECVLVFIDTSKNHSRRWCSMEMCGNRSKVNSFNKRNKTKKVD
ncbi:MAG: CGNR zinc finger domain-containing protein [Thiovulaceae bacterium]|nr:CGNR zinc finger domain-containing protein [Sulfurimonadaceae bacterium]